MLAVSRLIRKLLSMNEAIENLVKLQDLEFPGKKQSQAQIAELRELIPQPILAHYDRLMARGKKGVAFVKNQVCTGCNMRLPIGTVNTVMQGNDLHLCDNCGRYLYVPAPAESPASETEAPSKPRKKPRKSKALASTV